MQRSDAALLQQASSEADALRRRLRSCEDNEERLRRLAEKESSRGDSLAHELAGARRAAAGASSEVERLQREVVGLRQQRDSSAHSLEEKAQYCKRLEARLVGGAAQQQLVEHNGRLKASLEEARRQSEVREWGRGTSAVWFAPGLSRSARLFLHTHSTHYHRATRCWWSSSAWSCTRPCRRLRCWPLPWRCAQRSWRWMAVCPLACCMRWQPSATSWLPARGGCRRPRAGASAWSLSWGRPGWRWARPPVTMPAWRSAWPRQQQSWAQRQQPGEPQSR